MIPSMKHFIDSGKPEQTPSVGAVIVAAGRGSRMGGISKPEIKIGGKTLLNWVLDAFLASEVREIVVVCGSNREDLEKWIPADPPVPIRLCSGGKERSESVWNGISALSSACEMACVHDCARPFVTPEIISDVLRDAAVTGAASACCPVTDTIKYVDPEHKSVFTPRRDCLISLQTPQIFRKDWYLAAYATARKREKAGKGPRFTDETSLLENAGFPVAYTECPPANIKLTTKDDILTARAIHLLRKKAEEEPNHE